MWILGITLCLYVCVCVFVCVYVVRVQKKTVNPLDSKYIYWAVEVVNRTGAQRLRESWLCVRLKPVEHWNRGIIAVRMKLLPEIGHCRNEGSGGKYPHHSLPLPLTSFPCLLQVESLPGSPGDGVLKVFLLRHIENNRGECVCERERENLFLLF